jgi:hypothetical protein
MDDALRPAMNLDFLRNRLEEALDLVAKGEVLIARQQEIVDDLTRNGEDTYLAHWLLQQMLELQQHHIRRLERARKALVRRLR